MVSGIHARDHLSVIDGSCQRCAADDVSEERWEHVAPSDGGPSFGSDHGKKENFHRTGDDVGQVGESDNVGHDDDDQHAPCIDGGEHPNHHGDEPAGKNAAQQCTAEANIRDFL